MVPRACLGIALVLDRLDAFFFGHVGIIAYFCSRITNHIKRLKLWQKEQTQSANSVAKLEPWYFVS